PPGVVRVLLDPPGRVPSIPREIPTRTGRETTNIEIPGFSLEDFCFEDLRFLHFEDPGFEDAGGDARCRWFGWLFAPRAGQLSHFVSKSFSNSASNRRAQGRAAFAHRCQAHVEGPCAERRWLYCGVRDRATRRVHDTGVFPARSGDLHTPQP